MFPRRTHPSSEARITSPRNPLLKEIRKAVERGSLTSDGLCIAEGIHLLEEALRGPCVVEVVIAAESAAHRVEPDAIIVSDSAFQELASTETTQGVIALVRPGAYQPDDLFGARSLVLVLDGIQDPGNAGTLLRAAEAFGATGVLFPKGSVNPWNPKTVRASAGSVFRIPISQGGTADLVLSRGIKSWTTDPHRGVDVSGADLRQACAIVIGSEARGVSREWSQISEPITIPTERVESLNAAVAAAIVLYEAYRQRQAR